MTDALLEVHDREVARLEEQVKVPHSPPPTCCQSRALFLQTLAPLLALYHEREALLQEEQGAAAART